MKKNILFLVVTFTSLINSAVCFADDSIVKGVAVVASNTATAVTSVIAAVIAIPVFILAIIPATIYQAGKHQYLKLDHDIELCKQAKSLYIEQDGLKYYLQEGLISNGVSYVYVKGENNFFKDKYQYSTIAQDLKFNGKAVSKIDKDNIINLCPTLKNAEVL